jgi:hypothetical protein
MKLTPCCAMGFLTSRLTINICSSSSVFKGIDVPSVMQKVRAEYHLLQQSEAPNEHHRHFRLARTVLTVLIQIPKSINKRTIPSQVRWSSANLSLRDCKFTSKIPMLVER